MTEMNFKTDMYTLSVTGIKNGKGNLKLSMNKDFSMEVTSDNFTSMIEELSNGLNVFNYNYYLRQMIKDVLDNSKPPVEAVDESEGVQ